MKKYKELYPYDGSKTEVTMSKLQKAGRTLLAAFVLASLIIVGTSAAVSAQSRGRWQGEYFNNMTLSGTPALVRTDEAINFNWGGESPHPGTISSDNFSVRWTGNIDGAPGQYKFIMSTDDGGRLWVNGRLLQRR